MKRNYLSLIIVFLFVLVFVSPAYAIFCAKCGASNADDSSFCTNCGAPLLKTEEKPDIYSQSRTLFDQGEYDQVISLLSDYCSTSGDLKASIVLSNAYLEKCLILKESGDKRYKALVYTPFAFGKKLLIMHPELLSEGLYICAKSFYVNDRTNRASRYIKKAIKFYMPSASPISDVDYYFLLADVYSALARQEVKKAIGPAVQTNPPEFQRAKKTYFKIIGMDVANDVKGLAYYKLGILFAESRQKSKAREAFETALHLVTRESLGKKIRHKLIEPVQ